MLKKGIKKGSAFVLAAALAVTAAVVPQVYAAEKVQTDAKCSLEINVTTCGLKEISGLDPEVTARPVTVALYKVADIDVTGKYTPVSTMDTLDLSGLSSDPNANDWEGLAAAAKAEVDQEMVAGTMSPAATITTVNGIGIAENLEVGLYLVDTQTVKSDNYQYDFTPYLISLPNNYYYPALQDDRWVYDLTGNNAVGVKPARSDRYGDLEINKLLDTYIETLGGANFVFQIEGSRTDVDTGVTQKVYSDVVSMTFHNPGLDSLVISGIPAGSVMTVTEVYSGASYKLDSAAEKTVTILADQEVAADFENTYERGLNGGTGLVNRFKYDSQKGEWTYQQTEDSTP